MELSTFLTKADRAEKYSHAQFEQCASEMGCRAQVEACHGNVFCHDNMVEEKLRALEADPSLANAGVLIEGAVTEEGIALAECIAPRKLMTTACLYEKKAFACLEGAGCLGEVEACVGNRNCHGRERRRAAMYLRAPTPENAARIAASPRATEEGQALQECRGNVNSEMDQCMAGGGPIGNDNND